MNSDTPLVSIIVPIYNAEIYLADCLSSIGSQTYINIEVILVNDGSIDDSYNIAKLFCENDTRFQLVSQNNFGVAAAREKGLRMAQGEYVIHADSDDIMAERAIEYLYKSIIENDSNIAVGAYIKQNIVGQETVKHFSAEKDIFTRKILSGEYRAVLWNKLIKMDLCEDISFEKDINYMEDTLFLAKVLKKENVKISLVNEIVYFYRRVDSSYTNNLTHQSILSSIKVTDEVCSIFQDIYSDVVIANIQNKIKVRALLNSSGTQRKTFPESIKYIWSDRSLPSKHKVIIGLDYFHLNFLIDLYKSLKPKIF